MDFIPRNISSAGYVGNKLEKSLETAKGALYNRVRAEILKRRSYPFEMGSDGVERTVMPADEAFERMYCLGQTNFSRVRFDAAGDLTALPHYQAARQWINSEHGYLVLRQADISGLNFGNFPLKAVYAEELQAAGTQMHGPMELVRALRADLRGAKLIGPKTKVHLEDALMDEQTDITGELSNIWLPRQFHQQYIGGAYDVANGMLEKTASGYRFKSGIVPLPNRPIHAVPKSEKAYASP